MLFCGFGGGGVLRRLPPVTGWELAKRTFVVCWSADGSRLRLRAQNVWVPVYNVLPAMLGQGHSVVYRN